jgi:hypothetical protein
MFERDFFIFEPKLGLELESFAKYTKHKQVFS